MMRAIHLERGATVVLVIGAILALCGCPPRGGAAKAAAAPATPAAPQPLSIPQTRVELPQPQPVDPAALDTESAPQETPPAQRPPLGPPAAPSTGAPAGPPLGPRRAPTPPPVTPPPEPARDAIQEMISPTELKRLQDLMQGRRREVNQILAQMGKMRLTRNQANVVTSIKNFLVLSDEAEKRNDMRQADALAEKAQILARDLRNGK